MRWQIDIDSICQRLKNYSQLETIPPSSSLFSLPSCDRSTVPSFSPSLTLLYPLKLSLNFVSLLNRRNLETRRTVSNLSSLIVVVVLSKSANDGTVRTAGKAMLRQLPQCGLIVKSFANFWYILLLNSSHRNEIKSLKYFENFVNLYYLKFAYAYQLCAHTYMCTTIVTIMYVWQRHIDCTCIETYPIFLPNVTGERYVKLLLST